MLFRKSDVFLIKKSPRQGCTKPKTELGMHENPHFQQNSISVRIPVLIVVPQVNSKLGPF